MTDNSQNQRALTSDVFISVKVEMPLKSLETDPRFKAFLKKMNLPE